MTNLYLLHTGTHRAECLNPAQPGRRKVLEGLQYPFAVTSYGKNLYYTDWKTYVGCRHAGWAKLCPSLCLYGGLCLLSFLLTVDPPVIPLCPGCQIWRRVEEEGCLILEGTEEPFIIPKPGPS